MSRIRTVSPIQRTTLTEAAFEQLISLVVNGDWKPGDRIPPERDLCQQLGIARTSLREALKAMELVGMLNSRVGDGTFVCPRSEFLSRPLLWAFTGMDHDELHDIMESRMIIEESIAGLAAERGTNEQIARIAEAVQLMRDSIARDESILEADMAFHLAVSTAAQNEVLRNAVQLLRNLMRQGIYHKLLIPNIARSILKGHVAIYTAIQKRSPVAARRAMRAHLSDTMILVTQLMKRPSNVTRSAILKPQATLSKTKNLPHMSKG
jgi:GntR family transcriptional repressor for pyruvate dehydrogenase complex